MKTFNSFSTAMILAVVIIVGFYVNRQKPESMAAALPEVVTSSDETNTVPVEVRIATTPKYGSLIQTTGMSETQAKEFAKDNAIPSDNHNQPVSHQGNTYILFPDALNPGDSTWFADNYANHKTY